MTEQVQSTPRVRLMAIGLATLAITAVFVGMIWNFLIALFLAAVFSAMAQPLYRRILRIFGNRKGAASLSTIVLLYICVLVPVLGLIVIAAEQAQQLANAIVSIGQQTNIDNLLAGLPDWVPFRSELQQAAPTITAKVVEIAGSLAGFFVTSLSAVTKGTASFFLDLFIMSYAMVFFLQEQTNVLSQLLRYSGLSQSVRERIIERVLSISRATIKGTLVIGIVQGVLGGLGFFVTGIPGASFWGVVIAVVSVIPGIGPSLVLVPGVIYLAATGETVYAVGLALWTALVVTTIDNVLRPILVGRDTRMPDLLILVSTLGGLSMFGVTGLLIGPVIAGLFMTIWQVVDETVPQINEETPKKASK